MANLKLHEKGEGVGLLGYVVLGILLLILIAVSFFAYKHFHKSGIVRSHVTTTIVPASSQNSNTSATSQSQTASSSLPNPTTSTATEATTGQTLIKIPQLNVEFTVPNSIDDVVYYYASNTKTSPATSSAVLSTAQLAKLDPACGVDSSKTAATLQGIGTLYEYPGKFTDATNPDKTAVWSKQFTSFYIAYNAPTSSCSKAAPTNTVAQTQATTLKSALASMTVTNS